MFENRCTHCKPRLRVSVKPPTQRSNPSPPPGRRSPESSSAPRAPLLRIPPDHPCPVEARAAVPSPRVVARRSNAIGRRPARALPPLCANRCPASPPSKCEHTPVLTPFTWTQSALISSRSISTESTAQAAPPCCSPESSPPDDSPPPSTPSQSPEPKLPLGDTKPPQVIARQVRAASKPRTFFPDATPSLADVFLLRRPSSSSHCSVRSSASPCCSHTHPLDRLGPR